MYLKQYVRPQEAKVIGRHGIKEKLLGCHGTGHYLSLLTFYRRNSIVLAFSKVILPITAKHGICRVFRRSRTILHFVGVGDWRPALHGQKGGWSDCMIKLMHPEWLGYDDTLRSDDEHRHRVIRHLGLRRITRVDDTLYCSRTRY